MLSNDYAAGGGTGILSGAMEIGTIGVSGSRRGSIKGPPSVGRSSDHKDRGASNTQTDDHQMPGLRRPNTTIPTRDNLAALDRFNNTNSRRDRSEAATSFKGDDDNLSHLPSEFGPTS